jgi:hypothetical protein
LREATGSRRGPAGGKSGEACQGIHVTQIFFLKLLLTFAVGSAVITCATIAAEKFGSKAGGLIAGIPSTVPIALFFLGLTQDAHAAAEATCVVPMVMGFSGVFLVVYDLLTRNRGFLLGIAGALAAWFALSALVYFLRVNDFALSLAVFVLLLAGSYTVLEKILKIPSASGAKVRYTPAQVAWRGLFSGFIVTFAVFLGKAGGPTLGGIFSSFPAVFVSTLLITARSRGVAFSRMVTKPLLVSALINVVVFVVAARAFFVTSGLALGTVLSYVITGASVYGTWRFIRTKMS